MTEVAALRSARQRVAPGRSCPLCASRSSSVLHAQLFVSVGRDAGVGGYALRACARCGFVYADIGAPQEELDVTYRLVGRPTERTFDLERLHATAEYVARHVPGSSRVLDAGCGTGALLTYLEGLEFANLVGLDPSPAAIDQLNRRGFAGYVGTLSAPGAIGTFDLVVLAHVLEHVRDLRRVFAALRSLLNPGGYVYAEVPNAEKYVDALYEPFHDVNTEHINHFSLRTLARLFETQGFVAVDTGEKWIECAVDTPYPAAYGLWRRSSKPGAPDSFAADDALVESVGQYVAASTTLLETVAERMAEDLRGEDRVALWGAGEFAQRLAYDTRFAGRKLVAVVDGSEQRRGLSFDGVKIEQPESLRALPDVPIVVGSVLQRDEIARAARDALALRNRIVTLYKPQDGRFRKPSLDRA